MVSSTKGIWGELVEDIHGAYFHRTFSLEIERAFKVFGSQLLKATKVCAKPLRALVPKHCHVSLVRDFSFPLPPDTPKRAYGPELPYRGSDKHSLVGLARCGAQAGSRSTSDRHCFNRMHCRELEGGRPGGVVPTNSPLIPSRMVRSVPYGIVLTEEKSKQKQFETLDLQTTLPSP